MDDVFEVDSKSGDYTHNVVNCQENNHKTNLDDVLKDTEECNENSEDDSCSCTSKHITVFHCTACSKYFKSAQGCVIHERSKKHKENVRTIENLLVEEVTAAGSKLNTTQPQNENTNEHTIENSNENLLTVDSCGSNDVSNSHIVTRSNSLNLLSHVVKRNVIEKVAKNELEEQVEMGEVDITI